MVAHPAAALVNKRWDLLAIYKDQYWRDRKKLGFEEALRVVGALYRQARWLQPGWPTQEDREQDFETHVRVAAALARTAPAKAGRPQGPRQKHDPPGTARRRRRVRRSR